MSRLSRNAVVLLLSSILMLLFPFLHGATLNVLSASSASSLSASRLENEDNHKKGHSDILHRQTGWRFNDDDDNFYDDDRHNKEPEEENLSNGPAQVITRIPSSHPSYRPSNQPSYNPSSAPTGTRSDTPTLSPSLFPTSPPTLAPTKEPSHSPSSTPSLMQSSMPSSWPSPQPTNLLSSLSPTLDNTIEPSQDPSHDPSQDLSYKPSSMPSISSSNSPSSKLSHKPTVIPSPTPTLIPHSQEPSSDTKITPYISCKKDKYNFGNTPSSSTLSSSFEIEPYIVHYDYNLQTNIIMTNTLNYSVTDQIKEIEAQILTLLIDSFFPECNIVDNTIIPFANGKNRLLNIFAPKADAILENYHQFTVRTGIAGMSSKPIDLANGESCDDSENTNSDVSCYIIKGQLSLFFSDVIDASDEDGIQTLHNTIKSIMNNGELDDCHPAIVHVRFRNETNINSENIAVNFDDNIINDSDDDNVVDNLLTFMLNRKMLVLVTGLSVIALLCFYLVTNKYRKNVIYEKRIESLQEETDISSGSGGGVGGGIYVISRPSSGDAFVSPDDDDLISCLSLQLSKSFESVSSKSSRFNLKHRLYEYTPSLVHHQSISQRESSMIPESANSNIQQISRDDIQINNDSPLHQSQQQEQQDQTNGSHEQSNYTHNGEPHVEFQTRTSYHQHHQQLQQHQEQQQQQPSKTIFNSMQYTICCSSWWKSINFNSRFCWYLYSFMTISTIIAVVKIGTGMVGTVGVGAQAFIVILLLLGVLIVVFITVFDRQAEVIVHDIDNSTTISPSTSPSTTAARQWDGFFLEEAN